MRYEFCPGDSKVQVKAHAPLHDAHATGVQVTGGFSAELDGGILAGPVDGHAEIRIDSFQADTLLKLNTLRWLRARKYPTARFDIGEVRPVDGEYEVSGTLAFAGKSGLVAAMVSIDVGDDRVTVSGTWTLVQTEFGLRPPRLAMLKVDDEIEVTFRLVATCAG